MGSEGFLIQVNQLTKVYHLGEVEVEALRGVSFTAERGEFIAIMGASGSGKSTFMNIIGLLDHPTRGRYLLEDQDVSLLQREQRAEIRNRMNGFVFQNFNLLAGTTALENVQLPLVYNRHGKVSHRDRAMEALSSVGLEDRANHIPGQLSGGQQQRVAIARALANDPALLLADEPTGILDSRTGIEILEIFRKLNIERSITVLLVTHEPGIAAFARKKVHFKDGKIEQGGKDSHV